MKLLTYLDHGIEKVGVLTQDENQVVAISEAGLNYKDMNALIEGITPEEKADLAQKASENQGKSLKEVTLCAPIPEPKQDIVCLGINYAAHAVEAARYKEKAFGGERIYPIYFSKRVNRASATGEAIPAYEGLVDSLDYEVELAVILGKDAKNVKEEEAFQYVFGYTVINDVSARNLQTRHKQWYFGKSLDGFFPMGPWIVTEDEFKRPPVLGIRSLVNGEVRQNATTDLLIFGISHVIAELTQGMTLKAGTIIAMGTPAGVGMGMEPPQFLKAGDQVCCEIEGIGRLVNEIKGKE